MKVISIVGPGRSGSTLLARMLGETPGAVNVGELRWLWERGIVQGRPCGCRAPLSQCEQWGPVLRRVGEHPSAAQIVCAQRGLKSHRRRWLVLGRAGSDRAAADLAIVRQATEKVLRAVAEMTDSHVVIDASKRPLDAATLMGIPDIEHFVVHLVRDPRATAFSWGRAKTITVADGRTEDMGKRGPISSAERWLENNAGSEWLRRHGSPDRWLTMRYEDLVIHPDRELSRILARLREPPVSIVKDGSVTLGTQHTVAGNPTRFDTGTMRVMSDDEWQTMMPRRNKMVVTLVAAPLLRRYGYPWMV